MTAIAVLGAGCSSGGEGFDDEAVRAALSESGHLSQNEETADRLVDAYRTLCNGTPRATAMFLAVKMDNGEDIAPSMAALEAGCPEVLDEALETLPD